MTLDEAIKHCKDLQLAKWLKDYKALTTEEKQTDNEIEIVLSQKEDGTWGLRKEPYTIIECATKEDYDRLVELVELGIKAENKEEK